jgi:hypothetical protein
VGLEMANEMLCRLKFFLRLGWSEKALEKTVLVEETF